MSCTPITPDDWTDTVETKCAEAFVECLSSDIGYNLRHYARIAHASHRMGEGCRCRPSRIPHVVPIASESARPATLTPEQPVKAPGQGGDLLLTRGTIVEADWPNGNRSTVYVDEGGYQHIARWVGKSKPLQWLGGRIVRVLTEDKPTPEPVLPRRIDPEDVRVGMVVERRKGEAAHRDRVHRIDGEVIVGTDGAWVWVPANADGGWSLWLIEDAPEPVDPDAEAIERVAQVLHKQGCSWCDTGEDLEAHYGSAREAWREDARAVLAVVREHTVTARAEQ